MTVSAPFGSVSSPFASASSSSYPSVRTGMLWRTDFLTPGVALADGVQYSAAGATAAALAAEPGHPGILLLQGAAIGDQINVRTISLTSIQFGAGGGAAYCEALVRMPTISDGTDNIGVRIGFADDAGLGDVTDGVWLENDRSGNGTNQWYRCTANGGVRTRTATGITAVANAWTRLRVDVDANATLATYTINGVAAGTVATNLPTTGGTQTGASISYIKWLGAGTRFFHVDYLEFGQTFGTSR